MNTGLPDLWRLALAFHARPGTAALPETDVALLANAARAAAIPSSA